ncbi:hypothetical protein CVD28_04035 [Bacillus sp. M6-12]|uniref:hypothetical protein n=1 Tax=Bacillus sp. M6-12 TaxID=2054166 RepID=UPI000C78CD78|nr:hypothetical protein [Bacillus sp. M6-12]PLS19595.1 hypothetical protein CVD28_04035 [Bacillus sp. M6-12]
MTVKTLEKEMGLLSEMGKNVLELKNVLMQNKQNPLIYNGLLSSINSSDYEEAVYAKLINDTVTVESFESVLVSFDKYTNTAVLKKMYADFQKKLSNALERKGQKYFTTESSPKDGGVVIIRKFGINLDFIKREFRLTDREARKLLKDGFVEKYAQLKLNAIMKDMVARAEKQFRLDKYIKLETSKFYFNETHEVYNIDFRIVISVTDKHLKATTTVLNLLVKDIDEILNFIHKDYYRMVSTTK